MEFAWNAGQAGSIRDECERAMDLQSKAMRETAARYRQIAAEQDAKAVGMERKCEV
jgi:hypothetical protein